MGDLVTIDVDAGVADVRFNRPDKYNALSPEMFTAISEAGDSVAADRGIRAVVISGNGPGFCAGLDTSSFSTLGSGDGGGGIPAPRGERPDNRFQHVAYVWKTLPVPVIAAIHGVAFGAGCQIALGADIRIARPDARFSVMEIKYGLVPDVAITQTARDVLSLDVVKDLVFTGRIVDGQEAQALGLVTRLADDPRAAALASAREIASKSPDAIAASKRLLEQAWHADPAAGLALEADLQRSIMGGPNQLEAVKAAFEKREAKFADRSRD
ncbi:MAG: crotonase/enoyl-CoA hydratase family protein [Myxococcota bacterium]